MPVYVKDYPRPQLVRTDWQNLNGAWDFAFDDGDHGEESGWHSQFPAGRKISVPFTYETQAGGIGEQSFHPVVWYSRPIPGNTAGKRTILHFEGSDFYTRVWVNGKFAGEHRGGYTRFSFDITGLLEDGRNILTVRVEDFNDTCQPRGKQRWRAESFGCWYVQTTGIWKSVWLEYVTPIHLSGLKLTPDLDDASLQVEWTLSRERLPEGLRLRVTASFEGREVSSLLASVNGRRGSLRLPVFSEELSVWGLRVWTPEHPELYDLRLELLLDDQPLDAVDSYFGMREISIRNGAVLLNGRPYYQRLILDQGYWAGSHLTPPSEEALLEDIEKTKALGFNGARKHQKVEDERYYYWCDVKGLLVWSEMPSPYVFGDDMAEMFLAEWRQVVKLHYNHPCVVTWVPVNESWGVPQIENSAKQRHFTEAVYHLTKSLDRTRPVIVNDGWEHTVSDIITLHDYEERGDIFYERYKNRGEQILRGEVWHNRSRRAFAGDCRYAGQPVMISEYGGAAYSGGGGSDWGYGNSVETERDLLARIDSMTTAIKKLPYSCGFCYTQLTDVQQEINGLLDAQRGYKADPEALREIFERAVEPDYR